MKRPPIGGFEIDSQQNQTEGEIHIHFKKLPFSPTKSMVKNGEPPTPDQPRPSNPNKSLSDPFLEIKKPIARFKEKKVKNSFF